jgi:hypothetical protein
MILRFTKHTHIRQVTITSDVEDNDILEVAQARMVDGGDHANVTYKVLSF